MSSQIASVANEPVRTAASGRPRRQVEADVRSAGVKQTAPPVAQDLAPPAQPVASATPAPAEVQTPQLEAAVENIRDFVSDVRRELQFSVDEDSGRTIITVIDSDTGEIIRQIPPEEVMQIAKSVADGAFNLIDSRA